MSILCLGGGGGGGCQVVLSKLDQLDGIQHKHCDRECTYMRDIKLHRSHVIQVANAWVLSGCMGELTNLESVIFYLIFLNKLMEACSYLIV